MRALALLVLACAAAGCATENSTTADGGFVERTYRTGSNIPVTGTAAPSDARVISGEDIRNSGGLTGPSSPPSSSGGRGR